MKGIAHREEQGTITVFLSLILILILSLICTIIEGARVSIAKVYAERAMTSAMDSVLAEYYGPLWEEYHIFGYHTGEGSETEQDERMSDLILDYMTYTFEPDKNAEGSNTENSIDLYDITPGSVWADNGVALTDYNGEVLINEAVEYMKYRAVGDGFEKLLGKLSLLEEPGKVSYIMEEKQKAEEELVEIDREILKLMELFDGLKTSSKGIKLAKDGSLMTTSSFIKKICYGEVSKETVGINNDDIFNIQREYYVDPTAYFKAIDTDIIEIEYVFSQIEVIQAEIDVTMTDIDMKQSELDALKAKEEKSDEDKQKIKALEKTINDLNSAIKDKEKLIQEQKELVESLVSRIEENSNSILLLIDELKPLIEEAMTSLDEINNKLETAGPLVEQYEEILTSQKGTLSEEIYEGLNEDLQELKKYTEAGMGGYDFFNMSVILDENLILLTYTQEVMEQAKINLEKEDYEKADKAYNLADALLRDYQIEGLTLDYSTLVYDKSKKKSPLEDINNLIQSGLTSLVIDPDIISDSGLITSELLPSEIQALSQDNGNYGSMLTDFFGSAILGDTNSGIGDMFGGFIDSTKTGSSWGDGVNSLAELLLFQEYLADHFGRFQPQEEDKLSQKPSALTYEQEYLLVGKASDADNLASVISRIIFIRMIFDFISVIKDSGKRSEAKALAAALVGFTGLPILVSITQVLILLLWSFAEALLDTSALLMGKEIPILKKSVELQLIDIFILNRTFIQEKAAGLKDTKDKLSLSYQDYLRIFLLLKSKNDLAYRSMDLMQENIRLRYETDHFTMADCIYGFDAKAELLIDSKFTAFGFLQKMFDDPGGYRFLLKHSYSY